MKTANNPEKSPLDAKSTLASPGLISIGRRKNPDITHILVIEERGTSSFLKAMLSNCGISQTTHTADEEKALQILKRSFRDGISDIDLIIIDLMTPTIDGLKFCRSITSNPGYLTIPIMLISSKVEWHDDMAQSCLDAGACDLVFKPLQKANLLPRLNTLLLLKYERDKNKKNAASLECELAEKKIMEARLKYMVSHDDLTGLCNLRRLKQAIDISILQAEQHGKVGALIYIDLDQFKVINDLEGHEAGDKLLIEVASLLRRHCRTNTTIARISSDEFSLLLEGSDERNAVEVSEAIRCDLENSCFMVDNRKYHICASIGISMIHPHEKSTTSEILARSDQACYEAKNKGRNRIHIFNRNDSKFDTLRDDAYWVPRIRNALSNSLFYLVFQPVRNLGTGQIDRYEALIRMNDDHGNMITPDNFIPVAERMGLIHDIDLWVVNSSFEALQKLPDSHSNLSLNVNLSSHAFQSPRLLPLVKQKIEDTGIGANRITFEITETAAVNNYEATRSMVKRLSDLGCRIALDDFGSGFNSFNHLKQLPVDYIKIDGGFISNLVNDPIDQTFVKSITEISKTLGKQTVAEFVADQEILDILTAYGVDFAQGYFIGKPSPGFLI